MVSIRPLPLNDYSHHPVTHTTSFIPKSSLTFDPHPTHCDTVSDGREGGGGVNMKMATS